MIGVHLITLGTLTYWVNDTIKLCEYIYYRFLFPGVPTGLNRYTPNNLENVQEWELILKSLFSHKDLNPRKRIGSTLREGLGDAVREVSQKQGDVRYALDLRAYHVFKYEHLFVFKLL